MEAIMPNLISGITYKANSFLKSIYIRQFFPVLLIFSLLFSSHVGSTVNSKLVTEKLNEVVHQNDSQRPKTTGEWNQEAREVKGEPGERLKRIGKESAEAVKEFGSIYPETAQKSASELKNSSNRNKS
jgi:hypothetical protein